MARIKAGETGDEMGADLSWFERFLQVFNVKPVFAGAFGTAVCAFLVSGVMTWDKTPAFAAGASSTSIDPTLASSMPTGASSVDEQLVPGTNLFDQVPLQQTILANDRYYLPNGN